MDEPIPQFSLHFPVQVALFIVNYNFDGLSWFKPQTYFESILNSPTKQVATLSIPQVIVGQIKTMFSFNFGINYANVSWIICHSIFSLSNFDFKIVLFPEILLKNNTRPSWLFGGVRFLNRFIFDSIQIEFRPNGINPWEIVVCWDYAFILLKFLLRLFQVILKEPDFLFHLL